MANAFKTKTFDGSSTNANTDMTIYTCPAGTETTIIGMTVANIGSNSITIDIKFENADGNNTFLIKDCPVLVGSAFVPIGGNQKIVMEASDVLKVQCDTANASSTTLSILEIS